MDKSVDFMRWLMLLVLVLLGGCHRPRHHFSGYTDTLYTYLSAPHLAYVEKKLVERGQVVQQGQLLFQLSQEPDRYSADAAYDTYQQARHQLKDLKLPKRKHEIRAIEYQILQTQAAMQRVNLHLQRLLRLQKQQFIDQDTIDNQMQTLKELSFQTQQYQENLKQAHLGARPEAIKAQAFNVQALHQQWLQAQWYLQHKQLIAPSHGFVFDTFYTIGELVPAQKPVLVMVIPENNYLEFFVNARDMAEIKLGQMLHYQFYGDSRSYQATVFYISNTSEYMPPVLYTPDYQEELVFRVRAKPKSTKNFVLGQPVDIYL